MIVLLAAALAASPEQGFWARDLGAAVRALENGAQEHAAFFRELVSFCGCEPLPELASGASDWEARQLLRVEAARRPTSAVTVWRDVERSDFFRRSTLPADGAGALFWPPETEVWPDEVSIPAAPAFRCGEHPRPEEALKVATPELEQALLANPALADAAQRLAYFRAARLLAAKQPVEAREAALALNPEALGRLAREARLLRLELGLDAPLGYVDIARADRRPEVVLRAAEALAAARDWKTLDALVPVAPLPNAPAAVDIHLMTLKAVALEQLGDARLGETLDALFTRAPADHARLDFVRELAVARLAREPLDGTTLARLEKLGAARMNKSLADYAARALRLGNLAGASAAAARLVATDDARARVRGWALAAEHARRAHAPEALEHAVASLFAEEKLSRKERELRDATAVELAHTVALGAEGLPPKENAAVRRCLATIRAGAHERYADALCVLARAVEGGKAEKPGAATVMGGEIEVAAARTLPPPPEVHLTFEEPYSLLAIPFGPGFRAWFDDARRTGKEVAVEHKP